jgi:hypothetical protein
MKPYLEKTHHKKGLVEWLKVQALSSNRNTTLKKKKRKKERQPIKSSPTQGIKPTLNPAFMYLFPSLAAHYPPKLLTVSQ